MACQAVEIILCLEVRESHASGLIYLILFSQIKPKLSYIAISIVAKT